MHTVSNADHLISKIGAMVNAVIVAIVAMTNKLRRLIANVIGITIIPANQCHAQRDSRRKLATS